jgi:hypothetical protein
MPPALAESTEVALGSLETCPIALISADQQHTNECCAETQPWQCQHSCRKPSQPWQAAWDAKQSCSMLSTQHYALTMWGNFTFGRW